MYVHSVIPVVAVAVAVAVAVEVAVVAVVIVAVVALVVVVVVLQGGSSLARTAELTGETDTFAKTDTAEPMSKLTRLNR